MSYAPNVFGNSAAGLILTRANSLTALVPSSFRGDEFQAIADAIFQALKPYRGGLHGLVLVSQDPQSNLTLRSGETRSRS